MDKLLWESLPVERPRELVILDHDGPRNGWVGGRATWSYPAYEGLRTSQQSFADLLAVRGDSVNFTVGSGETERAALSIVSGNYFEILGVRPRIGRLLTPEDNATRGASPVVVMSYGFWRQRFGGRPDIVGRSVRLNGAPFTVIGVSEERFNGLVVGGTVDLIAPAALLAQLTTYGSALDSRSSYIFQVYGRLKPGISRETAAARMQPLYMSQVELDVAEMGNRVPRRWREGRFQLLDGRLGTSGLRRQLETPLAVLMAMVGAVLLIACTNLAGLLMARGASRQKEMAVRLALGATRWQLVRPLLAECVLLSVAGGAAGLVLAAWILDALVSNMGETAERLRQTTQFLNLPVLTFTAGLSLLTALLFGFLPAVRASRETPAPALKGESAGLSQGGGQVRLRKLLVTAQVSLALVLLTAAGLFVQTLRNLRGTDAGFQTENLIQFSLNPVLNGYERTRIQSLFDRLLPALRSIPGVRSATSGIGSLLAGNNINFGVEVEGYQQADREDNTCASNAVAPGFFSAMGVPFLRGRDFTERDTFESQRVLVVNESLANHYFKGRDPIGRHIALSWGLGRPYSYEIVGVAKDIRSANLREPPARQFFMPYTQWDPLSSSNFYVRVSGDVGGVASSIRSAIRQLDAGIPVTNFRTIEEQIDRLVQPERMVASLSAAFGGLAMMLAAIGIYGVMAFVVNARTREIGIRIALGAGRPRVLWLVLREVAIMGATGTAIGLGLALGLARYIESQLFGVAPRDWITLVCSVAMVGCVMLLAGYLPASRAASTDPIRALRYE